MPETPTIFYFGTYEPCACTFLGRTWVEVPRTCPEHGDWILSHVDTVRAVADAELGLKPAGWKPAKAVTR